MSYTVTLYYNTGYDSINFPDSPALLGQGTDFPAIDYVQNYVLSSITIRASFNDVKSADFCKVGDFYYSVDDVRTQSGDVVTLMLTPAYTLSAGGPAQLTFLDGITKRCTTKTDDFGEYCLPDEYLGCEETEELSVLRIFNTVPSDGVYTVVESVLDLEVMESSYDAEAYTESNLGMNVIVPSTVGAILGQSDYTQFKVETNGTPSEAVAPDNGTACFDFTSAAVAEGVRKTRGVAAEGSIVGIFALPVTYITAAKATGSDRYESFTGKYREATPANLSSELPNHSQYAPHNNRLNYGDTSKVGMISASGSKCEYNIEEVIDSTNDNVPVCMISDPRPDGKPYFRFKILNKAPFNYSNFFLNSISGLPWRQVPFSYDANSGTAVNQMKFSGEQQLNNLEWVNRKEDYRVGAVARGVAAGTSAIAQFGEGGPDAAAVGMGNYVIGEVQRGAAYMHDTQRDAMARRNELMQFNLQQQIVVPTIEFPVNNCAQRDFVGNSLFVYRYYPTVKDLRRMDKILTAYGYRHTEQISADNFNRRQYFDYVQTQGVSIGGNLPKWHREGIANELNGGIRVWHTAPSASYYTSGNPIVTPQ